MSYIALYRKFRPDNFSEVKGQDHIVTALTNQVKSDRIGHAYLFCGTRGTGKTSVAKILARAANCENPQNGSPCNECTMCRMIQNGTSMNVIEIDAASNTGVDNIREIRDEVAYRPTEGRYRVYIIDEVHMLSAGAFNALLKTLEEPPSYVIFILATTEFHKVPATILSRCQRYDFHRISIETIAKRLKELLTHEGVEAEDKALTYIARAGDGSMRDALSLLEQCISYYMDQPLTYENVLKVLGAVDTEVYSRMFRMICDGAVTETIALLEDMLIRGREPGQFTDGFIWYIRNLLLIKTAKNPEELVDASRENLLLMKEEAEMVPSDTLMRYIRVLSDLSGQLRYATQKRVLLETTLIKLCTPAMETDMSSILDRIRVLERDIQKRPPSQVIVQNALPAQKEDATPAPEEKPIKAAPEEIRQVVARWKHVINSTDGLLKSLLPGAVPKYDPGIDDSVIYVTFESLAAEQLIRNREEREKQLENIIFDMIHKKVQVKLLMENEHNNGPYRPVSIDQAIADNIKNMDVEIEEDDDPETETP